MTRAVTRIAVAAVSARLLTEAAVRDGHEVVALDLFGDADTRRACTSWRPIGAAGSLHIDATLLLDALADLQRRGAASAWVAGSGFDGAADLLERGSALLPLAGTAGADVRRLRDPRVFFAWLSAHGIAHPAVLADAPASPEGWLRKDAGGCGGWHIRRAGQGAGQGLSPTRYFQRELGGTPMSMTFLANGRNACVLGLSGVIGPVPLAAAAAQSLSRSVRELAAAFGLRGLGSLDFMLDGDAVAVLEVNPRPPASLALYPDVGGSGAFAAHLRACVHGELPALPPLPLAPATARGTEIVFARAALRIDDAAAARLAAWPDCHDLPHAGTSFSAGDPVCSLATRGTNAGEVETRLARARDALLATLETMP